MANSVHVCLQAGENLPGSPRLDLTLTITGQKVAGNATLTQGGVESSSLDFYVNGSISAQIMGDVEYISLYLEGQTYIATGGNLVFHGITVPGFKQGRANYQVKLEGKPAIEVKRQTVVRTECTAA